METGWMPSLCLLCALCQRAINQITDTSWIIYSSECSSQISFCSRVPESRVWRGYSRCRYVIGTLELLVAENYMIVYLNGATSRKKMPTVGWLRKCYQQIDRRWVWVCTIWETRFFFLQEKERLDQVCEHRPVTPLLTLVQATEELEVLDYRAPLLVYSHPAGTHQTFHKASVMMALIKNRAKTFFWG